MPSIHCEARLDESTFLDNLMASRPVQETIEAKVNTIWNEIEATMSTRNTYSLGGTMLFRQSIQRSAGVWERLVQNEWDILALDKKKADRPCSLSHAQTAFVRRVAQEVKQRLEERKSETFTVTSIVTTEHLWLNKGRRPLLGTICGVATVLGILPGLIASAFVLGNARASLSISAEPKHA